MKTAYISGLCDAGNCHLCRGSYGPKPVLCTCRCNLQKEAKS